MTNKNFKKVRKALDNNKEYFSLNAEGDYDDEIKTQIEAIDEDLDMELGEDYEVFIRVHLSASGVLTGNGGDYYNPPNWETEWSELEVEILKVFVNEDEVTLTEKQEAVLIEKVKENIDF